MIELRYTRPLEIHATELEIHVPNRAYLRAYKKRDILLLEIHVGEMEIHVS